MAFLVSPGVNTSEIDLTTSVPAVGTSTGATVGSFRWGPADTIVAISDETQLVSVFGKPDNNTAVSFLSAANFLNYGNDLRVVRVLHTGSGATNFAVNSVATANTHVSANLANGVVTSNTTISNDNAYFLTRYGQANSAPMYLQFAARYPGKVGNSLKISYCANASTFNTWTYKGFFDREPGTSNWAISKSLNGANDEIHLVVIDELGEFSGTPGTILERFPNLSKASDARGDDGTATYYKEFIYRNSKYIHWLGHPEVAIANTAWGQTIDAVKAAGQTTFFTPVNNVTLSMYGGFDGRPTAGDVSLALDKFKDPEEIDISLLFIGDGGVSANNQVTDSSTWAATVAGAALTLADTRKDCIAFVSPKYEAAVANTGSAIDINAYRFNLMSTSYGVMDSGWKYQYDKYNDVYRWVPLNADVAGLCVRTDQTRDPWFSPAGFQRGQIRNVVKLSFNPKQADRDSMYKLGINPVVSFPGDGTLLYGDKTMQGRPSAFDRINVRRLFIVLEKSISRAAKAQLFEFNDEFTRAQFVNLVDPFLRGIKGRRGIFDYKVVCDTTNNTPEIIDSNRFVGDIYVKPARSINFIQLNFVAVRTGVSFEEIVGKF
jgi:phage tail sheath protein FI